MLIVGGSIAGTFLLGRGNANAEGTIANGSIVEEAGAYERIRRFGVFWRCEGGPTCTEGSSLILGVPISILSFFVIYYYYLPF